MPNFIQLRTLATVFALSVVAGTSQADDCSAILDQGIRNTYQSLRNRDLNSGFKNAMCSNQSSTSGNSAGGGLDVTVPIYGVPVSFGGKYNEARNVANSSGACSSASGNMSDSSYEAILSKVADSQIVQAWSECKAKAGGGFYINGDMNGSTLTLEFRFRPSGNVYTTKVVGEVAVIGADCKNMILKNGFVVGNNKTYQVCTRYGNDAVTVVVNTEFDGARFYIPAVASINNTPQANAPLPRLADLFPQGPPGQRQPPGMNPPLPGYFWCVIDRQFLVNGVQGYCMTPQSSGSCRCGNGPPGMPQPDSRTTGTVYSGN